MLRRCVMKIACRNVVLTMAGLAVAAFAPAASAAHAPGKAVYEAHCAVCHGKDGRADTPVAHLLHTRPRDFADPIEMARVTHDRMYAAIENGRPGTAMAAWGGILSAAQIGDVMDYIVTLSPASQPSLTTEQLSLEVGRRLYEKECAACHGVSGRADTDVAKVLRPAPRDFDDPIEMARLDDGRMYAAINFGVDATAMPSWRSRLTPIEIIDVMRYIRSLAEPLPSSMTPEALDVVVGAEIYHRYCSTCHGDKGDAATALGEALFPPPRNFTDVKAMALLSDTAMAEAITHGKAGTSMAPWGGILDRRDVRRVIRFIRQTFQHQAP